VAQNQKDWGQFEKNRADIAPADVVGDCKTCRGAGSAGLL
jgi:hypothetical protein